MISSITKICNKFNYKSAIIAVFSGEETFQCFFEYNETNAVDSIIRCVYKCIRNARKITCSFFLTVKKIRSRRDVACYVSTVQ